MEGVPQQKQSEVIDAAAESLEYAEAIERATEILNTLKECEGTDIVGSEECRRVEELARELTEILATIPAAIRRENGLPWHPHDEMIAANDEQFAVAA